MTTRRSPAMILLCPLGTVTSASLMMQLIMVLKGSRISAIFRPTAGQSDITLISFTRTLWFSSGITLTRSSTTEACSI